jgi:hypothetical protein
MKAAASGVTPHRETIVALSEHFDKAIKQFKGALATATSKRSSRFDSLEELVDWLFEEAMGAREQGWESLALDLWKRVVADREQRRELLMRKSNKYRDAGS